jgi:hypothetical protein
MLKLFSMLVVAGVTTVAGFDSVRAADGCAPSVPATARVSAAQAPATAARPTQTSRRYSSMPSSYAAPAMRSYRSSGSRGPSWSASRKILGY